MVLEGGNAAKDDFGASWMTSLSLLTTHNRPLERLFTTSNATSAASALCAGMAARIMAAYPHLRAETVRALVVHSAQWSDSMRAMFLPAAPNKDHYVNLIRHCGWGAPDLDRALWSAGDSLTLVVEDLVHPYEKVPGKVVTRDMNLHSLPWPKDELEALQDTPVEMRVTLSYFVEPNPSARGVASKYHYPSHRLRFDVQRPLDASTDQFVARLNAAAQREDEGSGDPVNPPIQTGCWVASDDTVVHCIRMFGKGQPLNWLAADSLLCIPPSGGGERGLHLSATACLRVIALWSRSGRRRQTSIFTLPSHRRSA